MASVISRRQQVRNERLLQDLIKTVPGNDTCADCGARNPGWASWSLGVFLCMRCAALHRKLGTHLSKVKSLSMDSWSNEHIENMKRIGNIESNRLYNPRNVKPSIPIDVDEVDGAMERFIRQKYEHRVFSAESRPGTRQNTGSTSSVEDRPPPLPPKPGKKMGFGLRATSSTFPAPRPNSARVTPPVSPGLSFGAELSKEPSPPRVSKASRVFGSNIERPVDSFDAKLVSLREMGFTDEKRNATVLKGLNGNLDGAVEALIRLGEGSRRPSRAHSPTHSSGFSSGLSVDRGARSPGSSHSMNPFDALDKPQPPPPAQYPSAQTQQIQATGYNPFLQAQPSQPAQTGLDQSFQALNLAAPQQQQLFPHTTGGFTQAPSAQMNPFFQSFTPSPVPQLQTQFSSPMNPQSAYQQHQQQQSWTSQSAHPTSANASANPFLRTSRSQIFSQPTSSLDSSLYGNQNTFNTNSAFSTQPQNQAQLQVQAQAQPTPFSAPLAQTPFTPPQQQNPFFQHSQPATPFTAPQPQVQQTAFGASQSNPFQQAQQQQPQQQQQQQQYQQQQYQQQPQQNPTFAQPDPKASIMALYNYPQLAPARPAEALTPATPSEGQSLAPFSAPQRSVTMPNLAAARANPGPVPVANSHNPFAATAGASGLHAAAPNGTAGVSAPVAVAPPVNAPLNSVAGMPAFSRESVDFAGLMAGRHSPDAFKGLSSRWGVS